MALTQPELEQHGYKFRDGDTHPNIWTVYEPSGWEYVAYEKYRVGKEGYDQALQECIQAANAHYEQAQELARLRHALHVAHGALKYIANRVGRAESHEFEEALHDIHAAATEVPFMDTVSKAEQTD
jgi:hypothetical protein